MTNPMNAIRDFKANRAASADNVAQFRREAPIASIHHARTDEAEVEVVFEPVTCEENTMNTTTENTTVDSQPELANTTETTVNVATAKAEEAAMNNTTEQTQTISVTDFATRVKNLNRKRIGTSVLLNSVAAASVVAGAAMNGRDVRNSAIVAGIISGGCVAIDALSSRKRALTKALAESTETTYQEAVAVNKKELTKTALWTAATGMLIGAFWVKKAVANVTESAE